VFRWLFRKALSVPERLAVNCERVRELFGQRFPTGAFSSCDFRPHFDGYGHNAWVEIEPLESAEATRVLAYARLAEMIEFLRPLQPLFGPHDRVQFAVGFPEAVKPTARRIFKGWIPAARLADVQPPDFAAVGGAIGENDVWAEGLWT
jgi:hypothetical protein